uniref:Uncharacterized protein n=1 Tax=Panagrolaimus sp. ES5 TaxID=591445 RepID=A0AC34FT64_9BILA
MNCSFPKFLKCIIILCLLWSNVYSVKLSTCNELLITANCSTASPPIKTLFTSEFKLSVNFDSGNVSYPNEIVFSNHSMQNFDNSLNLTDSHLLLSYGFSSIPNYYWNFKKSAKINFPNSAPFFTWGFYSTSDDYQQFINVLFNNGKIFKLDGEVLQQNDCFNAGGVFYQEHHTFDCENIACCTKVVENDIPDTVQNKCERFESKGQVILMPKTRLLDFVAIINIIPEGLLINITEFASKFYTAYELSPFWVNWQNHIENCTGYSNFLVDECIITTYSEEYLKFIDLSFSNPPNTADVVIAAKIMYRNGIFLKDDYTPFTIENPCWTKSAPMPYFTETRTVNVSLCCVEFGETSETITTLHPTSSTTKFCQKYHSETQLSDNSIFLEVEYILNTTKMAVSIVNYFSDNNVITQLESYSFDTFSQVCRVTSSAPTNLCFFDISNNHSYELQLRASIFPDGFNMTTLIENNGQIITPFLTSTSPCHTEKHTYNGYGTSQTSASTTFCCVYFN